MSTRNIRKLFGGNTLPAPDSLNDSDNDFEPPYAKDSPSKFKFQGLTLSSHSESEQESNEVATEPVVEMKKKKRKKKKQRKGNSVATSQPQEDNPEMDEIDKVVLEVNTLLGTPPPVSREELVVKPTVDFMTPNYKHLNVANEIKRLYGTDEDGPRRRGRQTNILKKVIVPIKESFFIGNRGGLSMSLQRTENDCMYFTFDHSREYQKVHSAFLRVMRTSELGFEAARTNRHVEALLEAADSIYRVEEYTVANTIVEQIIAYMQQVAHPSFNLTNPKVRLEYKYPENRPFHIALLKYMYTLTNKACHRTALELGKLLLNLDPSDPLAVVFIIDTLAIRAREHQWFIEAFERWNVEREAGFLFNMRYTYALANYHVAVKNKEELTKADELLRDALMRFPVVALRILQYANMPLPPAAAECPLFSDADKTSGRHLKDLITIYGKFCWSWWREPGVIEWLKTNVDQLAKSWTSDAGVQKQCKDYENERLNLFRGWPDQIVRHLSIIKSMSGLLFDGDDSLALVYRALYAFDPLPPADTVNRYNYNVNVNQTNFAQLFATLV